MNRRTFLSRLTVAAAAGAFLGPVLRGQPSSEPQRKKVALPATQFVPLRRNVGLFTGRGGTIGWLSSEKSLVAVDTQFPDTASLFLANLPGRGSRSLDAVINTHHHADHTSGNGTFKKAAKMIVGQRSLPIFQLRAAEVSNTLAQQVFADTLFDEVWRHDLGDEVVSVQYFGPAHTGSDSVVLFEKANVVHVGDLVFNRIYPVVDRFGGASVLNWVKVLETVARDYPADAIYVFGHGNSKFGVSGARADLLTMRDYFSALLSHVEKQIAAGKTKAEVASLENLDGFQDFWPAQGVKNRLPSNLEAAYDELTAKQGA